MRGLLPIVLLLAAATAGAVDAGQRFTDAAEQARYESLIHDIRCLVCRSESIADSNAPLAADLRREVAEMMRAGKSDADIRAFMTARYGDFVLFKPPFKANTFVLWVGPFALLVLGGIGVAFYFRRRGLEPARADELSADERSRVARLLREDAANDQGGGQ